MHSVTGSTAVGIVCIPLLLACDSRESELPLEPRANAFARSGWSAPLSAGPAINSTANDQAPSLSPDGLSLYFLSNRDGGLGGNDIWIAHRACNDCEWQPARNAGAPINSPANDGGPNLSPDGLLLFLTSNRPGSAGGPDIWVSRRTDPRDDFSWGEPVPLDGGVNTPGAESTPSILQAGEGPATLYFVRGALPALAADIYTAQIGRDGRTLGPATLVTELSEPMANDASPSPSTDGREIYFWSVGASRPEAPTVGQIFVSTRPSVSHPWSPPQRLPAPINSETGEIGAELSFDGRTLFFVSGRSGGVGGHDIYVSTRRPGGM